MKRLFLNFETLPDIAGARLLYKLPSNLSDKDTGKVLFHHHVQEEGRDARFLSPWQARLAMVSLLSMHDEEVKLTSYQMETGEENLLLEILSRHLAEHDMTFCWDEGRGINALLHTGILQVALGIATLLLVVPISLAALHQGVAMLLFTVALFLTHSLRRA